MSALLEGGRRPRPRAARRAPPRNRSPRGAAAGPPLTPEHARVLLAVAFKPSGCALVSAAALVVITLVAASSDLTGTYGAVAAGWLGIHQVPLTIGQTSLGVLPLLPTIALMSAVARMCARATEPEDTNRDLGWLVGAAVAGPFLISLISLAVINDAAGAIPLAAPNPLASLGWVVGLHLCAALVGIAFRRQHSLLSAERTPLWAAAVVPAVTTAIRRLLGAAAVVTVLTLLWSWSEVGDLMHTSDGFVGILGLTVLSLAYLPNVVVGTLAVSFGGTVHIGTASIGMLGVVDGPIPPLPALAGVPTGPAGVWWPVLAVVPMYVAVVLGRECALRCVDRVSAITATAVASVALTVLLVLLAVVGGGELGSFGHLGVTPILFAGIVFGCLTVFGCVSTAFAPVGGAVESLPAEPPTDDFPVAALPSVRMRERVIEVDAEFVETDQRELIVGPAEEIVDAEVVETESDADHPGTGPANGVTDGGR